MLELGNDLLITIQAALAQGDKLYALRLVREQTGCSVIEGRRFIDELAATEHSKLPATNNPPVVLSA
jgi:hypothetical protein